MYLDYLYAFLGFSSLFLAAVNTYYMKRSLYRVCYLYGEKSAAMYGVITSGIATFCAFALSYICFNDYFSLF